MSATEVEIIKQTSGASFREVGYTGLKTSGGQVIEEFLPQLRTLQDKVRTYSEMQMDPTVSAVLFAIGQFIRGATWGVDAAGKSDVEKRDADFLYQNMHGMSHGWVDFVDEALTFLPYGFSLAEIVYKRGDDGSVRWKKLPFRSQETVAEWKFDREGGIKGIKQNAVNPGSQLLYVEIPIEKLLLFRTTANKNNPEGSSVLRGAYKPWYYKKRIEIIEAIGIERDLAGYPLLYVPDELFLDNDEAKEKLKIAVAIVTQVRKDENMGAVLPGSWEKVGGLRLLSSEGSKTMDTDRVIQRNDVRIAMSVLSDVILMGHENAGSYALAEVKRSLLGQAMMTWLDIIEDVMNRYAVPRLFALNGKSVSREQLPRFVHGPVVNVDPKMLADIIFRLAGVDAMRPDAGLRTFLRKFLGLPEGEHDDEDLAPALTAARARDAIGRQLTGRPDNETRPPAA